MRGHAYARVQAEVFVSSAAVELRHREEQALAKRDRRKLFRLCADTTSPAVVCAGRGRAAIDYSGGGGTAFSTGSDGGASGPAADATRAAIGASAVAELRKTQSELNLSLLLLNSEATHREGPLHRGRRRERELTYVRLACNAIRRNQTQSDAIRRDQTRSGGRTQTDAIRRTQTQSRRLPMYGSKRSDPKSIVKNMPASIQLTSREAAPCES